MTRNEALDKVKALDAVVAKKKRAEKAEKELKAELAEYCESIKITKLPVYGFGTFSLEEMETVSVSEADAEAAYLLLHTLDEDASKFIKFSHKGIVATRKLIEKHPDMKNIFVIKTTKKKKYSA
jgi:hypothetical protein